MDDAAQNSHLTRAQRRALPIELTAQQRTLADAIISQLDEQKPDAQQQILALIQRCGMTLVQEVFEETLRIQGTGGLRIKSGQRARTPGGTFFFLMNQRISPEERRDTLLLYREKAKKRSGEASTQPQAITRNLAWEFYRQYASALEQSPGKAVTVKISFIGRPGIIKIDGDTVMTLVEHTVKTSTMPKGVPIPPAAPTTYAVYISLKQWRRVEQALNNPEDAMIVEGVCAYDSAFPGMVVFATNVLSKLQESEKRAAKASARSEPRHGAAAKKAHDLTGARLDASERQTNDDWRPTPPDLTRYPIPKDAPSHIAQKLYDLYSAAEQFRHKLQVMDQQQPVEQRLGYSMAEKLLKNTEAQIAQLEKPYRT